MEGKIQELIFPKSYLVDHVGERLPHNGKIKTIGETELGYKTIANDSITQKMFLITKNVHELEFTFSKNPWEFETGSNFGNFNQLISLKFRDIEVSNSEISSSDIPSLKPQTLAITLHDEHPYLDSIRMQCVLSLQNNPSNVKHICFLEVFAENSKATLGGQPHPNKDGKWSIGTPLPTTQETIEDTKVHVFAVEELKGPLVFTGVGIDNFAGFVFQLASLNSNQRSNANELIDECFFKNEILRFIPADITNYEYFESLKRDHTAYQKRSMWIKKQPFLVRNTFRELAVEDANIPILFQQLNYFYFKGTTQSPSKIISSMVELLGECFANNKLGMLQSVIRINHLKAVNGSSINPPVRQIWSTVADTMFMVKQLKLERPNLNMIECAILSEIPKEKLEAVLVAIAQCLMAFVLALHVLVPKPSVDGRDDKCDAYSILINVISQEYTSAWYGCWMKCYWRVDFSFMMTIIAVVMVMLKVVKQVDDQRKFYLVFDKLVTEKKKWIDGFLLILDIIVNFWLPFLLVLLTFILISKSDEVTDLVLNCLATTFIVELDDDLNKRDTVEVDDLVIETFRKHLLTKCKDIDAEHNGKSPFDKDFLKKQLISADYSTDPKSSKRNEEVLDKVQSFIEKGKLLPVVNTFLGDPHYGKTKHLALRFRDNLVISVQEHSVVDFSVIEKMVKSKSCVCPSKPERVAPSFFYRMQVMST